VSGWTVEYGAAALRDLRSLHQQEQRRVVEAVRGLAEDPRPYPHSRQLTGALAGMRRLRVGEVRVGYQVDEREHVVIVWVIGQRSRFYELMVGRVRR
jgi:mRNA interferase RelE/StbE